MIPADTDPESSLAQVREWLPWFAAGGLAPDERQFVQTWLARQGPQHPELAAELEWLRCTAAQVRELADVQRPAPESGLAELMARIGAERPGACDRPHRAIDGSRCE